MLQFILFISFVLSLVLPTISLLSDIAPVIGDSDEFVEIYRRTQLPLNADNGPIPSDTLSAESACLFARWQEDAVKPLRVGIFLHLDDSYVW